MNSLTSNLLQQAIGNKIDSLHSQRGRYGIRFQSYTGYGSLIMSLNNEDLIECFFYSKEDEKYGFYEVHNIEVNLIEESRKKSWLPKYWGKSHSFSFSLIGMDFQIKKILVYGEKYQTEGQVLIDTDYLLIFESTNGNRILVKSDGVFDEEYRIDFSENEINNHFDLKREDGSPFYTLKKIIQ